MKTHENEPCAKRQRTHSPVRLSDVWTIREGPHEKGNDAQMGYESHETDAKDPQKSYMANDLQTSSNSIDGAYATIKAGACGMDDIIWLEDPFSLY